MDRDITITDRIFKGTKTSSSSSEVIKCFSAYMEKYCKDFKYSSRYLNSHLKDFEDAVVYNNKFELDCDKFKSKIMKDKKLNHLLNSIKASSHSIDFIIEINKSITFRTKSDSNTDIMQKKLNDVLNADYLTKFVYNSKVLLDIVLTLNYDGIQITEYHYNVDSNSDYIQLIFAYFNKAIIEILKSKDKYMFYKR